MQSAGIECSYAKSDDMNHVWNMVKIGEAWYHVDATWGDVGEGNDCKYSYFLKSDEYFNTQGGHYNWISDNIALSAWYDDYYFNKYDKPFFYAAGQWYAQKNGSLYEISNLNYGGEKLIYASDTGYRYTYFGVYEGNIVYNTAENIYVFNLNDWARPRIIVSGSDTISAIVVTNNALSIKCDGESYTVMLDSLISDDYFEIKEIRFDGELEVDYTYDDLYDREWDIFAAGYDGDGICIFVKKLEKGEKFIKAVECDRYKVFIWEYGNIPLCDNKGIIVH